MDRNYIRFYALREMKARPKTFLPVFAIFFGVMLLMSILLIYFQCELTSDVAYYKVETQLILPDLTDEEVILLRQIEYVNQAEAVPDEDNRYTCYVELTADRNETIARIHESLLDVIDRLGLEERSDTYIDFFRQYNNPTYGNRAFEYTRMLNRQYMNALEDSMFNPSTLSVSAIAALMMFAVVVLVYRMKVDQACREYACLVGMGLTLRDLSKIQYLQGLLLMAAAFVPSHLLAIGTMKLVSVLSFRIYPNFDGNQAILFDIPWLTLGITFLLYLLAMLAGIWLCMRPYRVKTVSSILSGAADRIPFVEKSSVQFLSEGSFDGYGRVWKKRNRRNVLPMTVLFFCLILFPSFLFGGMLMSVTGINDILDTGSRTICSFNSYGTEDPAAGIPYTLLQEIAALDGVDEVYFSVSAHRTGLAGTAQMPDEYMHEQIIRTDSGSFECSFSLATCFAEEAPESGTVWVPASFPAEEGDTVTLIRGSRQTSAVIGRKMEFLPAEPRWYDESIIDYAVLFGEDLYPALCGPGIIQVGDEVSILSSVPEEEVEALLNRIAVMAGDTKIYLNDYDRQLHGRNERSFILRNAYYEHRIWVIKNTFITLFTLAQTVYLLLCAASVIHSTIGFQLSRRRSEFSVLRALGLEDSSILGLGYAYTGNIFRVVIPVLYPVMVLLLWTSNSDFGIRKNIYTGQWEIGALNALRDGLLFFLVTCVILYLFYGITSRLAAKKTVEDILHRPLAETVKERE